MEGCLCQNKYIIHWYQVLLKKKMTKVKKTIISVAAATVVAAGFAVPALAAGGGYCVNSANGCTKSDATTGSCAGHGAFGAFSGTANDKQKGSAVHGYVLADKAAGTSLGAETGPANSGLCGNPQN